VPHKRRPRGEGVPIVLPGVVVAPLRYRADTMDVRDPSGRIVHPPYPHPRDTQAPQADEDPRDP
jgi:hypothetical protein